MLNTIIHPVGTVTSNLPVNAELPKQIRKPSCTMDKENAIICETPDFSVLPKRALLCWGFILTRGEGGKKIMEV
jgi:hypothetical protein